MARQAGLTAAFLILALLAAPAGAGERPKHPDELSFDPLSVEIPNPERFTLENGIVVYLLEDHELPLVDVTLWMRTGGIYVPPEKTGLAMFTGAYVRNGGTASMNRMQVDQTLEFLAAGLNVQIGPEHGEATLSVLAKDLEKGLAILSDVVRRPAFDPSIFMLLRQSVLNGIRRQEDTPAGVLGQRFPGLVYGDHPYGRVPTEETVSAITREDCVEFWNRTLSPDQVMVGVSGDVTKEQLAKLLTATFGDWERKEVVYPEVPSLERKYDYRLEIVPRPEPQSHIRLAHLGLKRTNPDRVRLQVMNLILGGGSFSSRLTEIVRVREGLAYSVYSQVTLAADLGLFAASVQTKGETTYRAIDLILREMKRIREEPVSDEELALAKDMILNGLVFSYSQPAEVVRNRVLLEYYGYPEDWMHTWRDIIANVTKEEVQRVAKQYLRPDGVTICVVGNPETFDERPDYLPAPNAEKGE
jgi:predicted Zn-dependent peptidase